ncbi:MAG: hypothetical protein RL375_4637 [Pseudomonadota bacterium]
MHRLRPGLAATALALACLGTAQAGRPLATDDAGTAGAGNCQVESWWQRGHDSRSVVVAPACGIGDAVEVNGEIERSNSTPPAQTDLTLGAKWVDPGWKLGPLAFGLKAWFGQTRWSGGSQQQGERGVSLLVSTELGADGAAHINLGRLRDPADGRQHTLLNLALTWKPADHWLTFAEVNAVRRSPTEQFAGVRYWLHPEVLGLDLTVGQRAGQPDSRVWTLGLGWYGLRYL